MFPLKGIIPPIVTPLEDDDALDHGALERILNRCLDAGVHGVFILGTTGEGPALSQRLRREVVEAATRIVNRRAPVLVGVTDTSLADSLALAAVAAGSGADAVVTAGPCYFPASQSELLRYMEQFARASALPTFVYNMPSHTKVSFEAATVRRLAQIPGIVGVKDSSAQMLFFQQLLAITEERPDFTVLMGPEELLAESVLLGGHGGVCGGANLIPELYVALYEAAVTGDLRQVMKLQQRVQRLSSRLYTVGDAPSAYLAGLKAALACLGLGNGRLAPPTQSLLPDRQAVVEQHLLDLGLIGPRRAVHA
ncbi:MAG: dihydrodipicolinate synthase family protein [Planctomyces sp.]|nr:dihydrodipicolinate synthase family protein [Planctomyces sp.]